MQYLTCNNAGILVLNRYPNSHLFPGCVEQAQNWFWNSLKIKSPQQANPGELPCIAVVTFQQIRLLEHVFLIPSIWLDILPNYFAIKIIYIGIYLYWVLHLDICRDVRGHTDSTCVQLCIAPTCACLLEPSRWTCHTYNWFYTIYIVCRSRILVRFIF